MKKIFLFSRMDGETLEDFLNVQIGLDKQFVMAKNTKVKLIFSHNNKNIWCL